MSIASGKSAPFKAQTFLFLRVLLFIVMQREYHPEAATASRCFHSRSAADSLAFVWACRSTSPYKEQKYVRKYRKRGAIRKKKSRLPGRVHGKGGISSLAPVCLFCVRGPIIFQPLHTIWVGLRVCVCIWEHLPGAAPSVFSSVRLPSQNGLRNGFLLHLYISC